MDDSHEKHLREHANFWVWAAPFMSELRRPWYVRLWRWIGRRRDHLSPADLQSAWEAHLLEHRMRIREPWEGVPLDEQTQFWGPKIQNVSPEERVRLLGPKIQNSKQEPNP